MAREFSPEPIASEPTGELVTRAHRPGFRPHVIRPEPYFHLMFAPGQWEAVEMTGRGWTWLPKLKKLPLLPGVNGVRFGRPHADASLAIASAQQRGLTVIPDDYRGGFVMRHMTANGWTHLHNAERLVRVGLTSEVRGDRDAWNEFRYGLVVDGIIPPPSAEELELLIDRQRRRLERNQKDIHIPAVAARVEAATAKLEGMEAAASELIQ